jgi:ATP-dependent RNA helicase MRH4
MSPKTPFAITYKKPGTAPPVFLAGSFSDPQWQLQEMGYTTDQDGEHTFQSEVMLEPQQDYQFKLRIGHDNWWVLAENYPTGTSKRVSVSHTFPNKISQQPMTPAMRTMSYA